MGPVAGAKEGCERCQLVWTEGPHVRSRPTLVVRDKLRIPTWREPAPEGGRRVERFMVGEE